MATGIPLIIFGLNAYGFSTDIRSLSFFFEIERLMNLLSGLSAITACWAFSKAFCSIDVMSISDISSFVGADMEYLKSMLFAAKLSAFDRRIILIMSFEQ